jgi:hypothetical protein
MVYFAGLDVDSLPPVEVGIERLVIHAVAYPAVEARLLRDPRGEALRFGLTPAEADRIADLRAPDLLQFRHLLRRRLYGIPINWQPVRTRPDPRPTMRTYLLRRGSRLTVRQHGNGGPPPS